MNLPKAWINFKIITLNFKQQKNELKYSSLIFFNFSLKNNLKTFSLLFAFSRFLYIFFSICANSSFCLKHGISFWNMVISGTSIPEIDKWNVPFFYKKHNISEFLKGWNLALSSLKRLKFQFRKSIRENREYVIFIWQFLCD